MKVTFLSAGTGSYHCGACMRDNALVKGLHDDGHEVALLPMYLPMTLDEEGVPAAEPAPIFFGGINIFLQQKFALFRRTPRWIDRLLDGASLLRLVARRSHMTSARAQGEMTLAMLRLESGHLTKELDKLVEWLRDHEKPELVCLSNALLAGLAHPLKERLGVPVVVCFQGEDTFLDQLPDPCRQASWEELGQQLAHADGLAAPSRFYADLMAARLQLDPEGIRILPNGIDLQGFEEARRDGPPVIGFFARMIPEKGLKLLVDAFIEFRHDPANSGVRLHVGGACTAGDEGLVRLLQERLEGAGLGDDVTWRPNLSRDGKIAFLRELSVFSVPVTYPEAFGLYLVEAMACGVPVVQPRASSFPEIMEGTGAGVLVEPESPSALADGWKRVLADSEERKAMGERGRRIAAERYSVRAMKDGFVAMAEEILAGTGAKKGELIS